MFLNERKGARLGGRGLLGWGLLLVKTTTTTVIRESGALRGGIGTASEIWSSDSEMRSDLGAESDWLVHDHFATILCRSRDDSSISRVQELGSVEGR